MNRNHYILGAVVLLLATALLLFGQGQSVRQSEQPADLGSQSLNVYSGTDLTYRCVAPSSSAATSTITVTTATAANPGVFTATAHGFDYQSGATITVLVFINGFTGGWTGLNGLHVLTPSSANALTSDVDTSGFGAFGAQVPALITRAVRTTDAVWAIQHYVYDGSHNTIWSGWAAGAANATATSGDLVGGRPSYSFACASRTTYAYQ